MYAQAAYRENLFPSLAGAVEFLNTVTIEALEADREEEVLAFLSERPLHTVAMAGMVRDHGLVSKHNRGMFYGCRDRMGHLVGVALIGHSTLIEARTSAAIREFARRAQG